MGYSLPSSALGVKVVCLTMDPMTNLPSVLLRHEPTHTTLAIAVGLQDASAIATELNEIALERPTTHRLMIELLERSGARVTGVEIYDFEDDTFFAAIHLMRCDGVAVVQESRPSDALVIALRTKVEIRIDHRVVDKIAQANEGVSWPALQEEVDVLDGLSDEAFGEWKM